MSVAPRLLVLAALLLAPAACGGLLPPPAAPPQLHRLTAISIAPEGAPKVAAQLLVDVPEAPAALDTTRIALARGPTSVDYFANVAWTDRAPLVVQSLIVEALENAGQIAAVARESLELRADAVLMSELRRFEAEYRDAGAPVVRAQLLCRLVKMPERSILASRSFEGAAPAAGNDMPAIIAAFDEAFHAVLRQVVPWAAESLASRRH